MICGLSRAAFKDIDRCAEAIKPAKRRRIHTFISTSPVHMKYKLQKEPHEVYEMVIAQVSRARGHTDDVEWSAEDATRTERDFLCRCVEAAINAGATTINIPDTVGYTVPEEYFALIEMLRTRVPNADKARFSTHCHNDLGMSRAWMRGLSRRGASPDEQRPHFRAANCVDAHRHARNLRSSGATRPGVFPGDNRRGRRRSLRVVRVTARLRP